MSETGRLVIRYSEVTWYEITLEEDEVAQALGGRLPGELGEMCGTENSVAYAGPEWGLWELIGSLVGDEAREVSKTGTDGGEIHEVTRKERP